MAKLEIGRIEGTKLDQLKTASRVGSDADLAIADRRSRARIVKSVDLSEGQEVSVFGKTVTVLGPGRGEDWFLAAWQEEGANGTVDCIGTFHESQIEQGAQLPADPVGEVSK